MLRALREALCWMLGHPQWRAESSKYSPDVRFECVRCGVGIFKQLGAGPPSRWEWPQLP